MPAPFWGLVDDRTGHNAQVLGLLSRLGAPYEIKTVGYNRWASLPVRLLGPRMCHLDAPSRARLAPPFPPLVVAAGRRMVPVLRAIKRQSPTTRTVYLMWPEIRAGLDLVICPEYDRPPVDPGILTTVAPIHAVTKERLADAAITWAPTLASLPRPYVTLCLGGRTKRGDYTMAEWQEVIARATALVGEGTLLVTTSRRSSAACVAQLPELLPPRHLLYRPGDAGENPYLGWLALADAMIVTGDSLSMCAEACATGVSTFIYASQKVAPLKHQQLHAALYARNLARPLDEAAAIDWTPSPPLDELGTLAHTIRQRFPDAFSA